MKKAMIVAGLAALLATTGCYTSRRVAGDRLAGGITNPALWVAVPVDIVLSPYQIAKWAGDENDTWKPLDVDKIRAEYADRSPYAYEFLTR